MRMNEYIVQLAGVDLFLPEIELRTSDLIA